MKQFTWGQRARFRCRLALATNPRCPMPTPGKRDELIALERPFIATTLTECGAKLRSPKYVPIDEQEWSIYCPSICAPTIAIAC